MVLEFHSTRKGAGVSANDDTVRRGYEAFGKGDMDTLRSIMTPDVIQNVPGKSQLAGESKGVDNVLGYYARIFELTGGTFKADLKSATAEGSDKVVAVHHIDAQRDGKSYDEDDKLHFTFTGGKISRLDEEHPDPAKFDDFWS
jgi:ketosteroid isomerase-like protein